MLFRKVFGGLFLLSLVASIGSARADLRQQYSEQGCMRWFKRNYSDGSEESVCTARNGNVFRTYSDNKIGNKWGEIGNAYFRDTIGGNYLYQFEFEGEFLVLYKCSGTYECSGQIKKFMYQEFDPTPQSSKTKSSLKYRDNCPNAIYLGSSPLSGWIVDDCHWMIIRSQRGIDLRFYANNGKHWITYSIICDVDGAKPVGKSVQRQDESWSDFVWYYADIGSKEDQLFSTVCSGKQYQELLNRMQE